MRPIRFSALPLLLALSACDRTPNELVVQNSGTSTVVVQVSYRWNDVWLGGSSSKRHHSTFEVIPGQVQTGEYRDNVWDMDVLIYRKSDGFVLFSDRYDQSDFDDDHGSIEIRVFP